MNFPRLTTHILRFIAVLQLLTFGLCLLPESTLAALYALTGMGQWPHLPFPNFLARGASYSQGAMGLLLAAIGIAISTADFFWMVETVSR